jgi:hypothetical protein
MSDAGAEYSTTRDGHQSQKIPINSNTQLDTHSCRVPLHSFRCYPRGPGASDAIIGPDL